MMKPTLIFLLFLKILCSNQPLSTIPVSTYSIVAYDPKTGQLGVAVQSHWFSVGFLVPWAKAGDSMLFFSKQYLEILCDIIPNTLVIN